MIYSLVNNAGKEADALSLVHVEDYWAGKLRDLDVAKNQCLSELAALHGIN